MAKKHKKQTPKKQAPKTDEIPSHEEEKMHSDIELDMESLDLETSDLETQEEQAVEVSSPEQQIQELQAKLAEESKKYIYLLADMDNLRKQAFREKQMTVKALKKSMSLDFLRIFEVFQQALSMKVDENSWKVFYEGVRMTSDEFRLVFRSLGLDELSVLEGEVFNPELHEAIDLQEHDSIPKDHIIQVLNHSYKIGEQLVKPARVVVSKGPQLQEEPEEPEEPEKEEQTTS